MSVSDFIASASAETVFVRTPDEDRLRELLLAEGTTVTSTQPGHVHVTGTSTDEIGHRAARAGLTLLELTVVHASLKEAFMALTHDATQYRAPAPAEAPSTRERIAA